MLQHAGINLHTHPKSSKNHIQTPLKCTLSKDFPWYSYDIIWYSSHQFTFSKHLHTLRTLLIHSHMWMVSCGLVIWYTAAPTPCIFDSEQQRHLDNGLNQMVSSSRHVPHCPTIRNTETPMSTAMSLPHIVGSSSLLVKTCQWYADIWLLHSTFTPEKLLVRDKDTCFSLGWTITTIHQIACYT